MDGTETDPRVNVLAVDDNPNNLTVIEAVLKDLPIDLYRAGSGTEAIRHVLQRDFAVVLMDLRMPGMDGFETARLIRQRPRTPHTPLLFVTAAGKTDAEMRESYRLGAADYLVKPFEPETVLSRSGA